MGSASASKSKQQSTSEGGSWNQSASGGSSYGMTDVWGAQQPALQQLYAQAGQLAAGQGQYGQAAQQVAGQAQDAWLRQLTPGGNPYFSNNVQSAIDQATQGFTHGVLPELEARGVGVGQYGGQRDSLARGEAAGQFGQALAQQVAGMYSNQYAADQQLAGQALGMSGAIQGMQSAPLTTAAGIIGGPAMVSQQGAQNWAQSLGQAFQKSQSTGSSGSMGLGVAAK